MLTIIAISIHKSKKERKKESVDSPAIPERTPYLRASYEAVVRTPWPTCQESESISAKNTGLVNHLHKRLNHTHTERFPHKLRIMQKLDIGKERIHIDVDDSLAQIPLRF